VSWRSEAEQAVTTVTATAANTVKGRLIDFVERASLRIIGSTSPCRVFRSRQAATVGLAGLAAARPRATSGMSFSGGGLQLCREAAVTEGAARTAGALAHFARQLDASYE
jgi:hypothetical protein